MNLSLYPSGSPAKASCYPERALSFTSIDVPCLLQAKDKVASARTKADEVSREVDGAVGTLKKIVKDLEDLSDIGKFGVRLTQNSFGFLLSYQEFYIFSNFRR